MELLPHMYKGSDNNITHRSNRIVFLIITDLSQENSLLWATYLDDVPSFSHLYATSGGSNRRGKSGGLA